MTVQACALLRGDLPRLRPRTCGELDAAFARAMARDVPAAAIAIRRLAHEAQLSARLDDYEVGLSTGDLLPDDDTPRDEDISPGEDVLLGGDVSRCGTTRGLDGFQGLPGDPGSDVVTIWTCPEPPHGHFRQLQRGRPEDVPACTQHRVPLVRETTSR